MTETFTEADLMAAPIASHRISGTKAACDGDENSRCRFWRACDYEGCLDGSDYHTDEDRHEHVYAKESCGWLEWVNATDLSDTFEGSVEIDDEGEEVWPEGPVEFVWDGDSVTWHYTPTNAGSAAHTKEA